MTAKHTPGPWDYRFRAAGTTIETMNDNTPIARVYSLKGVGDVDANARLIAAAPMMYAVLDHLLGMVRMEGYFSKEEIVEALQRNARRALDKVKGGDE